LGDDRFVPERIVGVTETAVYREPQKIQKTKLPNKQVKTSFWRQASKRGIAQRGGKQICASVMPAATSKRNQLRR
jgi:hypothetical protein